MNTMHHRINKGLKDKTCYLNRSLVIRTHVHQLESQFQSIIRIRRCPAAVSKSNLLSSYAKLISATQVGRCGRVRQSNSYIEIKKIIFPCRKDMLWFPRILLQFFSIKNNRTNDFVSRVLLQLFFWDTKRAILLDSFRIYCQEQTEEFILNQIDIHHRVSLNYL